MASDNKSSSWCSVTARILFSPRTFPAQLAEPFTYRKSVAYLAKTALAASLTYSLGLTVLFYVILASFASILTAFMAIIGTLLTPAIAVVANIPPEKVPAAIESFARSGGLQVAMISVKLGVFLLVGFFAAIMTSTCLQAVIAHGIARLLGCAGSFRATAAAYSFGSAAWMLSVIPVVNLFAPLYATALSVIGMRHAHQLSLAKAAFVTVASAVAIVIGIMLSLLHQ